MLLIQEIDLTWHKNERGGRYAQARRRFPRAYPLDGPPAQAGAAVHHLSFYQNGETFLDAFQDMRRSLEQFLPRIGYTQEQTQREIQQRSSFLKRNRLRLFPCIEDLDLTDLSIRPVSEGYSISFFYDEHRSGMPYRRGHNQDFLDPSSPLYHKDCLNETAFILQPGQYGRIVWNERRTDYDDRTWYYQLHICNLFHTSLEQTVKEDIFLAVQPDLEYKQIADLY
ncbi:hypothetical protein D7V91_13970 [bacterium 1xD42-67]|nr:hypothetical protein D7V91_13970 [bacterium 1xD42-67]